MLELSTLSKIDVDGLYNSFLQACDVEDGNLSVVEWLIKSTFLNGDPYGFAGFEDQIQPLNDMYPRQVIIKPAQRGVSEAWARKILALLHIHASTPHYYMWDDQEHAVLGITGIYSFPNFDDALKFSKHRLKSQIIESCQKFKDAMAEAASSAAVQIGLLNSFLYLTGRNSDSGNQSIPAEVVFVDEFDRPLGGDKKILSALAARTKGSKLFGNKYHRGLLIRYGTPTITSENGSTLDGLYQESDQHEWMIKPSCGHWQTVIYPDSIANFYDVGQKRPKKTPYWMCLKCGRAINFKRIGKWDRSNPLKVQNAEWVPKFPERTKTGEGLRGYRIPFASLRNTAQKVLTERDTDYRFSKADFYNYGLGFAFQDNSIGLSDENFISCRTDEAKWGVNDFESIHVMGIDQGCYLTVAKLKKGSQTDTNPAGIWQMIWIEYIPEKEAFTKVILDERGQPKIVKGEIAKRISYWNPSVTVMDRLPNTASADQERELHKLTMWLCDSKGNRGVDRIKYEEEDTDGNLVHRITENRNLMLDEYFEQIRGHRWEYPLEISGDQWSKFTSHHKNLKKVTNQEDKSFTYEAFGQDHYGQAGKLCSEAAELYGILKPRVKRAGILIVTGYQSRRE